MFPSSGEQLVDQTVVSVDLWLDVLSDSVDPAVGVSLSPVQSQRLDVPSDFVDAAVGVSLSPVQSQLLTCAAGCQRAAVDAPPSPVQSQLLTCTAGCQRAAVDAPPSRVQSQLLTCAAGYQRAAVDAPLNCVDNSSRLALSLCLRLLQRTSLSSAVSAARCCRSRSLLWRKLSSDDCLLRLDPAIGERGRSSLSMVDSWIITLLKTMKSLLY